MIDNKTTQKQGPSLEIDELEHLNKDDAMDLELDLVDIDVDKPTSDLDLDLQLDDIKIEYPEDETEDKELAYKSVENNDRQKNAHDIFHDNKLKVFLRRLKIKFQNNPRLKYYVVIGIFVIAIILFLSEPSNSNLENQSQELSVPLENRELNVDLNSEKEAIDLQEVAKQEIAKQEAITREAVKQEAVKQEAAKQEAAKQEAIKQKAAKQEAAKQEAAKQEAAKQEAAKQEAAKQEAAKQEAAKQEAVTQETAKLETEIREAKRQVEASSQSDELSQIEKVTQLMKATIADAVTFGREAAYINKKENDLSSLSQLHKITGEQYYLDQFTITNQEIISLKSKLQSVSALYAEKLQNICTHTPEVTQNALQNFNSLYLSNRHIEKLPLNFFLQRLEACSTAAKYIGESGESLTRTYFILIRKELKG